MTSQPQGGAFQYTGTPGAVTWFNTALSSSELGGHASIARKCLCLMEQGEEFINRKLGFPQDGWRYEALRRRLKTIEVYPIDMLRLQVAIAVAPSTK